MEKGKEILKRSSRKENWNNYLPFLSGESTLYFQLGKLNQKEPVMVFGFFSVVNRTVKL